MTAAHRRIPEPVKEAIFQGLRMLGKVGNRAIGAALKSAATDTRRAVRKADKRVSDFIEGVEKMTAVEDDEEIEAVVEGELVGEVVKPRARR